MVATVTVDDVCARLADAAVVAPVGGRTHWEVGGPPPVGPDVTAVPAPMGVVRYDPADLTVTVAAGTPVRELVEVLGAAGQECVLDPRDAAATVGGLLSVGLSGHRRLRYGPLRDRVLEVRFATADGRLVKGGGPTVKNVSGFDLPRLLVGSFGTLGVLVQVTLRCQPRADHAGWVATEADPFTLRRSLFRPSCVAWDGRTTHVLLEGVAADVAAERSQVPGAHDAEAPTWPDAPHRGRISVRPGALRELGRQLDATGAHWMAEVGVGTVHVAADTEAVLAAARGAAHDAGGWLLREAGAPGLDGFGRSMPNAAVMRRIKEAFDPTGKCTPGRLPLGPTGD
jgi:glycolate oxidase FAD binding subunit